MSELVDFIDRVVTHDLTIDISEDVDLSDAVDVSGVTVCGAIIPSTYNGTALSFQVSADGANYYPMYDTAGNSVSYTVSTSRYVKFNPDDFAGVKHLKLSTPNQSGEDTVITLLCKAM